MNKQKTIYLNYFFYIFYILLHLLFVNLFPTNFEFTFSEGFKFYEDFEVNIINNFFTNNANTFAFSLFFGWLSILFQNIEPTMLAKIISSLSYIFLIIGIINLCKFFQIKNKEFFIIIILLNPLVFILGFKGTPDLVSTTLCVFALSYILFNNELTLKKIIYYLIFGLGICLKPINAGLILFLIFYYYSFSKNTKIFKYLQLMLILLIPTIYFTLNKIIFDFTIISDQYSDRTKSGITSDFFYHLILYFGYFSLILSPFIFNFKLIKYLKDNLINLFIIFILFYLGSNYLSFRGEMDLGIISNFIPNSFLGGLLTCSIYLTVLFLKNEKFENYKNVKLKIIVLIFILLQLLALSLFRPTQRYLITILPLIYIFLINESTLRRNFIYSLIIFIPINIILLNQHYTVSQNTKTIIQYLESNDLLKYTDGGAIKMHAGHIFSKYNNYKNEYIISNDNKDYKSYLKKFEKPKLFFLKENFYIIKIKDL